MNRIKILLVAILTTVLLTISVSGTLAWLQDNTNEVKNVFTPTEVDTEIEEPGWDPDHKTKSVVQIRNNGDIPVYVRVAVVGNWIDDEDKVVAPWTGSVKLAADSKWFLGDDGFYYYSESVAPDTSTDNLLGESITATDGPSGSKLVINVVHQSIQYAPVNAVNGAWPEVTATFNEAGTSGALQKKTN